MNLKTWCLQIWGVNTLICLQYKNIICRQESKHSIFSPTYVCPLRKRLPLSCNKNNSKIFDATKLWKHTIPFTYNTKTLISNISETHRFSPQMRLITYPDHKTTLGDKLYLKHHLCLLGPPTCYPSHPLSVSQFWVRWWRCQHG